MAAKGDIGAAFAICDQPWDQPCDDAGCRHEEDGAADRGRRPLHNKTLCARSYVGDQ
jgi:hypothetical protein